MEELEVATVPLNRIAEFRAKRNMTQEDLAQALGVHWITVSRLEREQMNLHARYLRRIAAIVGCRPYELLMEPEDALHKLIMDRK